MQSFFQTHSWNLRVQILNYSNFGGNMKQKLFVLVLFLLMALSSCGSHKPSFVRSCQRIETVPEFGFVFIDGENLGNAPVNKCFTVRPDATGERTIIGYVKWASGKTTSFRLKMKVTASYTYSIFHPPGEGFQDAQTYADSMLKKREIESRERAAAAAEQQAEAAEKAAKDQEFWNAVNYWRKKNH